jgi:putative transposase
MMSINPIYFMTNQPIPHFTPNDVTAAYGLRFHFGWHAHRRQPLFGEPRLRSVLQDSFQRVTDAHGFHVLEMELEPTALRAVLSLTPPTVPSAVTRLIKGNLAADARRLTGTHNLWSRGWFLRSLGEVTNETVRNYVSSQFEHHRAIPVGAPEIVEKAKYHNPADPGELRKLNHVVFEYNMHLVSTIRRRCDFLDPYVAETLIAYWRLVCERRDWRLWDVEVVGDHAHLFVGVLPTNGAEDVALTLMNNSAYFLEQRHAAVLAQLHLDGVWQGGFYAGSVGSATTSQLKSYLQRRAMEAEEE